jgi:lysophospholipase
MNWGAGWFLLLGCLTRVLAQELVTAYAPQTNVQCPNITAEPLIRVFTPQTQTLNPQESAYIDTRESTVLPAAWEAWIGDGYALDYNLSSFVGHFPRIGMAFSGGGFRAAQYGAGVLSALDARNDSAKAAGTGGLLQVSSYIAGLSGK